MSYDKIIINLFDCAFCKNNFFEVLSIEKCEKYQNWGCARLRSVLLKKTFY